MNFLNQFFYNVILLKMLANNNQFVKIKLESEKEKQNKINDWYSKRGVHINHHYNKPYFLIDYSKIFTINNPQNSTVFKNHSS